MRWALPSVRGPVAWSISIDRMMQLLDMLDGEVVLSNAEGRRVALVDLTGVRGDGEAFYRAWRAVGGRWLWLTRDVRRLHFHEAWRSTSTQEEG